MHLGQRVEGGEVVQCAPLPADPRVETLRPRCGLKDAFERSRLELEDLVVVDQALLIQLACGLAQRLQLRSASLRALDLFDAQVEGVSKATCRGVVRRGLVGHGLCLRSEWVEEDDRGAAPPRPATEASEIGQVSDAPAVSRTQGIELDRPAPGAIGRRRARCVGELETPDARRPVLRGAQGGEDGVGGRAGGLADFTLPAVIAWHNPPTRGTVNDGPST